MSVAGLRCSPLSLQEMAADTAESADSSSTDSSAQQFKYVLEPGTEKGKWVPVATGEDASGQVKSMTQAEADSLNKQ